MVPDVFPGAAEAPFGIYVHWPFCAAKCPYCDFNSHVRHGRVDEARFVAALKRELRHMADMQPGQRVASLFFGGGTPSLLSASGVAALIDEVAQHWPAQENVEITLEANPGSVEAERFRGYRAAGVNRVSLGLQALDDTSLKALGRIHTAAEALAALETARQTFARVSFDLIYARPGQSAGDWRRELSQALSFGPSHLSLYQLTIEEGTPFAELHRRGRLVTPPEHEAAELFDLTQELCEAAGLPAYEISNHAAAHDECQHNLVYWRYGTYAGAGPGAHGRLMIGGRRHATSTERNPEKWLAAVERNGHGMTECTPLTVAEQADEMLLMGLRLREGVDLERLHVMTGARPDRREIDRLVERGMLNRNGSARIAATVHGRKILNHVVLQLSLSFAAAAV